MGPGRDNHVGTLAAISVDATLQWTQETRELQRIGSVDSFHWLATC